MAVPKQTFSTQTEANQYSCNKLRYCPTSKNEIQKEANKRQTHFKNRNSEKGIASKAAGSIPIKVSSLISRPVQLSIHWDEEEKQINFPSFETTTPPRKKACS